MSSKASSARKGASTSRRIDRSKQGLRRARSARAGKSKTMGSPNGRGARRALFAAYTSPVAPEARNTAPLTKSATNRAARMRRRVMNQKSKTEPAKSRASRKLPRVQLVQRDGSRSPKPSNAQGSGEGGKPKKPPLTPSPPPAQPRVPPVPLDQVTRAESINSIKSDAAAPSEDQPHGTYRASTMPSMSQSMSQIYDVDTLLRKYGDKAPCESSVLLVERDDLTRETTRLLLERCEYSVRAVSEIPAARQVLSKIDPEHIDMLIIDSALDQPSDLLAFVQSLRTTVSPLSHVAIVVLADLPPSGKMTGLLEAGADAYVLKPIRVEDVKMLWQHIENRKRRVAMEALLREQLEKDKYLHLLHRMLPPHIVEELSRGFPHTVRTTVAEHHDFIYVLFSDIVGFTDMSSRISPLELVQILNHMFSAFDEIVERHKLYKVETIGDAYMIVGGLPFLKNSHPGRSMCRAALEMQQRVKSVLDHDGNRLHIRVGINAGPAVAGTVGSLMPRYCFFGDTINTASRMESTCVADRVQVSQVVRDVLQEEFQFEERGYIPVKGKGNMRTYFLNDACSVPKNHIPAPKPLTLPMQEPLDHPSTQVCSSGPGSLPSPTLTPVRLTMLKIIDPRPKPRHRRVSSSSIRRSVLWRHKRKSDDDQQAGGSDHGSLADIAASRKHVELSSIPPRTNSAEIPEAVQGEQPEAQPTPIHETILEGDEDSGSEDDEDTPPSDYSSDDEPLSPAAEGSDSDASVSSSFRSSRAVGSTVNLKGSMAEKIHNSAPLSWREKLKVRKRLEELRQFSERGHCEATVFDGRKYRTSVSMSADEEAYEAVRRRHKKRSPKKKRRKRKRTKHGKRRTLSSGRDRPKLTRSCSAPDVALGASSVKGHGMPPKYLTSLRMAQHSMSQIFSGANAPVISGVEELGSLTALPVPPGVMGTPDRTPDGSDSDAISEPTTSISGKHNSVTTFTQRFDLKTLRRTTITTYTRQE